MRKKKVNRKTHFVDLPVKEKGREKAKALKKKTHSKTYDEMIGKVWSEIMDQELI